MFLFSYHYKLPFDVYAYTFDMYKNKVYLLYLLTYLLKSQGHKVNMSTLMSSNVNFRPGMLISRKNDNL